MSNIYLRIDPSWSYNFLGGVKDEIDGLDFFRFTDFVYRLASDFIRVSHNFRWSNDAAQFNLCLDSIWAEIKGQNIAPVPYFQVNFRQLFSQHLAAFNALPGPILKVNTITTDSGELQGFVFEV